uniref:Phosphatidylinositol glycan, class K n=1 Tax=Tetraselmis sp. GSL018 TaxID=582737 RepID=A0A061RZI7_9CHLO|mmetsp:Transcript_27072/g.64190  ORF Transcript_27072/g.64190 Transcript_27072/m.64190 type:complete len:398 (-) Transcript_27072:126-1319(-)
MLLLLAFLEVCSLFLGSMAKERQAGFEQHIARWNSSHNNNWAVIVCTSRFWFNYRHISNALSVYHTVKRLGIPDSNILLMLADDVACNPRNTRPSAVYNNRKQELNLYGSRVEVDYRGYEVTVENFVRVLTGRHEPSVPRSKRLLTDAGSNVLVFLTGHGGDEFMKFQDDEELLAQDLADAIAQMEEKRRYNEMLLFVETCEAATMWSRVRSPRVMGMASSSLGEKSYSHHSSPSLGVSVIDRFTYHTLMFFEDVVDIHAQSTLGELFAHFEGKPLGSTAEFLRGRDTRPAGSIRVTDFFGAVSNAVPLQQGFLSQIQADHYSEPEVLRPAVSLHKDPPLSAPAGPLSHRSREEGAWLAVLPPALLLTAVVAAVALQPSLQSLSAKPLAATPAPSSS